MITIYTDGSCTRNPGGDGSWAFAVLSEERVSYIIAGYVPDPTTNNRMEILAVLMAYSHIKNKGIKDVTIYSDSEYVIKSVRREWGRYKNKDLWPLVDNAATQTSAHLEWVKGHSGVLGNEAADKACTKARKEKRGFITIYDPSLNVMPVIPVTPNT